MDWTKLVLGDCMGDVDLGGLSKLGFRIDDGFDSDVRNSDDDR
jgi:hypothetical protein